MDLNQILQKIEMLQSEKNDLHNSDDTKKRLNDLIISFNEHLEEAIKQKQFTGNHFLDSLISKEDQTTILSIDPATDALILSAEVRYKNNKNLINQVSNSLTEATNKISNNHNR